MVTQPTPDSNSECLAAFIAQAQAGSDEGLNRLLAHCRNYLLHIAEEEMDPDVRAREAPSDVVQQSIFEAYRNFAQFRGQTEPELRGWLRMILLNNLANVTRFHRAGCRKVSREVSLDDGGKEIPLKEWLASDEPSPSSQLKRHEQEQRLLQALGRLPENYQQVIRWQHFDHCSFEEIGRRLGRTEGAARHLWLRAVQRLREELHHD